MAISFHRVGIAPVSETENDEAAQRLQSWIALGYNADMAWMANPKRQNIRELLPSARSVIAVGLNYYTPHQRSGDPAHGKISRYAWGRDYHRVLTKKLKALNLWLEQQVPDLQSRYYVDTGPIQEKAWAERAGLGWVGKNGNLISRDYGSWLFLGEIVTNITLQGDRPHSQHCGTCTRCLEACPTQAIVEPFVVDSNKCIAYHTIENRAEILPTAIADNLQGWVAGCDICQDVCPWNQRFAQPTDVADFDPYEGNLNPELETLANITEADWQQQFTASALRRIKPAMLRRNAQANLQ
ncbi:tRNA epoxyqueuosine(34) reductase QueG [Synechocystis sp. PCC 6803]|nr:tRNA epoxyqueuosine(34) reductase QueG [Synechocystis sp. IPPAS B-1465]MBD2618482.1 tRNA epoxyqueuosine(34) reductase QueG [Synechocystis sp. FACHB-898]MBD2640151.1 tRNA epoxyqueuosine(34) reductase QueG [Synechocystis sp. FACHB-908]MBD2660844.1 tRNA epoxyqueuosine(34) reductase QueG [Synechocystis sp. FACHB-929]MCW5241132.1 tRNA epoxyqueuosine(34) reductase QueG [Synechocystis sp. PCC 6803]